MQEADEPFYSSKTGLHIGDYVALRLSSPREGWLSSEAMLNDDCFVTPETDQFDDCIWEIHVQNQYSATREYRDALLSTKAQRVDYGDGHKPVSQRPINRDHLTQLHRAAINEQRLNEKLMSIKIGKPVAFGDPIQLRHVKSRKFLTVSANTLAKDERENMRVSVIPEGNSLSCLGFMPRMRFEKEGALLTNNSDIMIRIHERPGELLHASKNMKSEYEGEKLKAEVNCSLESTVWTIVLYQRVVDMKSKLISAGQLVTLQDPDSLNCISLQIEPGVSASTAVEELTQHAQVIMSPQYQLRDIISEQTVGTNLLWLVEKANVCEGGPVYLSSDMVTLRDLNTGLYLKLNEDRFGTTHTRKEASCFEFSLSQSFSSSSAVLQEEAVVNLGSHSCYLCQESPQEKLSSDNSKNSHSLEPLSTYGQGTTGNFSLCAITTEKTKATSLIISTFIYKRMGSHVYVGVQAVNVLRKLTVLTKRFQSNSIAAHDFTNMVRAANATLDSLAAFLVREEERAHAEIHEVRGATSRDVIRSRQNMMREQGLLDVLLDILVLTETDVFNHIETHLGARKPRRQRAGTLNNRAQTINDGNKEGKENDLESKLDKLKSKSKPDGPSMKRRSSLALLTGVPGVKQTTNRPTRASMYSYHRADARSNDKNDDSDDENDSEHIQMTSGSKNSNNTLGKPVPDWTRSRRNSAGKLDDIERGSRDDDEEEQETGTIQRSNSVITRDISPSKQLAQMCLKVLLCLLVDNMNNQLHCADRFPILLSQVRDQRLAVLCVEEMLRENRTILQTKVREREINIFVDLLKGSEMSVTFLKLLKSTCSCPMGVDATQRMVTQAIFEPAIVDSPVMNESTMLVPFGAKRKDSRLSIKRSASRKNGGDKFDHSLIINILADRHHKLPTDWGDLTLYCPKDPNRYVMGYMDLQSGVPEIFLNWTMKGSAGEYAMSKLYGSQYADAVPLYLVCQSMRNTRSSVITPFETVSAKIARRKANVFEQQGLDSANSSGYNDQQNTIVTLSTLKHQVAEYFVTQMYLVADLCLDRNYVAINTLENFYEYDILLTLLKNIQLPQICKAAVSRVIRCLYVDREPQVATKFPRYIRTSVALGIDNEYIKQAAAAEDDQEQANEQYKFALVQKLLSEYLADSLDLHRCDELSIEMLQLLKSLVEFGFYCTVPQILDVLQPLMRTLDDHQTKKSGADKRVGVTAKDIQNDFSRSEQSNLNKLLDHAASNKNRQSVHVFRSMRGLNPSLVTPSEALGGGENGDLDSLNSSGKLSGNDYTPFQAFAISFYNITESISWMVFVLLIVVVTVVIAISQLFSDFNLPHFVVASMVFFIAEIMIRWFAYCLVKPNPFLFFLDPFNILDIALIILDIIITVTGNGDEQVTATRASRGLRILRAVRIIRLLRAARIIQSLSTNKHNSRYQLPSRYKNVSKLEANTVVTILQILNMFYDRIQDKNLDIAIKAFSSWTKEKKQNKDADAVEIFHNLMLTEENIPTDLLQQFDTILLDMIMYHDEKLTHEALQLLMIHKSQRDRFLAIAEKVQIICSPRIEAVCKKLGNMLRELRSLAEKFEIWGELSTEQDQASARKVFDILDSIKTYLAKRNEDRTLGIRSEILVDEEVQSLMRNLDAMSTFMTLLESLFDGGREELREPIRRILLVCNKVICLFVKNSEENQNTAFRHIYWFVERVDNGIGSSKVVKALLEGNRSLIKLCPRKYLAEFAHKIMTQGRKPAYLDMFLGMTHMSTLMNSRVPAVEAEISTFLTAREWKKHVLSWCCAPDSQEYQQRKQAMEAFRKDIDGHPATLEDLSEELQYHVGVITLLSSCNLGPKLHAIYPVNDVLYAILDESTIFPVRKALGNLLVAFLRTSTDRLEKSELFWKLLERIATMWENLPGEVVHLSRSPSLRIQRGEWLEITAEMIAIFFEVFDLTNFAETRDKSLKNIIEPRVIIHRLFDAAVRLMDDPGRIGHTLKEELEFVALVLRHHLEHDIDEDEAVAFDVNDTKLKLVRAQHQRSSVIFADVQQVLLRKDFKLFLKAVKKDLSNSKEEIVAYLSRIPWTDDAESNSDVRFEPFIKKVCSHFRSMIVRNTLSRSIEENSVEICIWFLRALRSLFESALGVNCDELDEIDVETVQENKKLKRLRSAFNDNGVTYLCLDLIAVGIEHELYIEAIKLLVAMLLKKGGSGEIQRKVYYYLLETDSLLFFELLKDLIENMKTWSIRENEVTAAHTRQTKMNAPEDIMVLHLIQYLCLGKALPNREQFREQMGNPRTVNILESLASYVGILSRSENLPNIYIAIVLLRTVLRLVQGPCRGNQEQFVLHTELLISLNRIIRSSRPIVQSMSRVWMDCLEELKEGVVNVLRGTTEGQNESSLVFDRVTTTIDFSVLHLLLMPTAESNVANSSNTTGVVTTTVAATPVTNDALATMDKSLTGQQLVPTTSLTHYASIAKGVPKSQAKYLVLAKSMGKAVASSSQGMMLMLNGANANATGTNKLGHDNDICRVEVIWNQHPQVVYFYVPDFINDISAESKLKALENIQDFASRELKLSDFVKQVKALFRESNHQQFLKRYGLSSLWTVKFYLTRFMFANAVVMNALILVYYGTEYHGKTYTGAGESESYQNSHRFLAGGGTAASKTAYLHTNVYISHEATTVIRILNSLQIILAVATVIILGIVQLPVNYMAEIQSSLHTNRYSAMFYALLDPLPVWYICYVIVAFLGLFVNPLFLSALLLDWIVLDDVTRDLLKAIHYPARQLLATLGMILIMLNVFAGIMFFFHRQDVITVTVRNMWDALKLCISYGFRGEYGIDHEMDPTLSERMVLDVAFYFIILSILRHIFFAIIVDTFGKLREIKFEREQEEKNSCFICGIERHDYDRFISPGSSTGFGHHRTSTHNPLHYMYFIMTIWNQSTTEDTSLEMHVRECLAKGDVSWFPTGVSGETLAIEEEEAQELARGQAVIAAGIAGVEGMGNLPSVHSAYNSGPQSNGNSIMHANAHALGGGSTSQHGPAQGHVADASLVDINAPILHHVSSGHGGGHGGGHGHGHSNGEKERTSSHGDHHGNRSRLNSSAAGGHDGEHMKHMEARRNSMIVGSSHGGGSGGGHGGSGGGSDMRRPTVMARGSAGDMDGGYSELLDRMQFMSKQLHKLSKQVTGVPNTNSNSNYATNTNASLLDQGLSSPAPVGPPLSSPGRTMISSPSRTREASFSSPGPAFDATAVMKAMTSIQDNVARVMNRIEKMEKKFSKSHKFLRHRVREQLVNMKQQTATAVADSATLRNALSNNTVADSSTMQRPLSGKTQQLMAVIAQQRQGNQPLPLPTQQPPQTHLTIDSNDHKQANNNSTSSGDTARPSPSTNTPLPSTNITASGKKDNQPKGKPVPDDEESVDSAEENAQDSDGDSDGSSLSFASEAEEITNNNTSLQKTPPTKDKSRPLSAQQMHQQQKQGKTTQRPQSAVPKLAATTPTKAPHNTKSNSNASVEINTTATPLGPSTNMANQWV